MPSLGDHLPYDLSASATFNHLWHNFFKDPTDTIGTSYVKALGKLRTYFLGCEWYEVYDIVEFLAEYISEVPPRKELFIRLVNGVLKEELSGFRFVSGRIVQITTEEEVASIEQALTLTGPLHSVTAHLRQSLTLLADKTNPDYRNSIKESISAIESLSKILSGLPNASLSAALTAVDKQTKLHPSLKEAFQKLYGYTSDAQGIRHALIVNLLLILKMQSLCWSLVLRS
jgi:hypothetical protein